MEFLSSYVQRLWFLFPNIQLGMFPFLFFSLSFSLSLSLSLSLPLSLSSGGLDYETQLIKLIRNQGVYTSTEIRLIIIKTYSHQIL